MQKKIAFYIVFVLIFFSNDSLSTNLFAGENSGVFQQIIYIFSILFLLMQFKNKKQNSVKSNLIIGLFALLICFTMLVNSDFTLGYIIQFISLYFGYVIATTVDFDVFAYAYNKILYYLSLTSIILFFSFLFLPSLVLFFPVTSTLEEVSYINLFFYVHYLDMFRNTGVFREPGVYMIFLNIGIMIELFYKKNTTNKYLIVYIVALITTLSTGGFLVFALIFWIYLFKNKNFKSSIQIFVLGLIVGTFIIYNFELFESTFMKFNSKSDEYGSTIARISSITVPFSIFLDSPIVGVGLNAFKELYEIHSRQLLGFVMRADGHSTNTLLNSLATYGLIFFLLICLGIYKMSFFFSKNKIMIFFIFLTFILMFSNEDLRYSILFSVLLFYGIHGNHHKPLLKK